MELLIPLHFSTLIYLSSLFSFLCVWLALYITLLVPGSTTILFLLRLTSLVLSCVVNLGLLQLAVAWEDRLKQGLCSTARRRCPRGCYCHSWPRVLYCPHCNRSMEFHQHCLRLKKHISSYDICCICLFVMVSVSYVMAVLLSCLIYLMLIPLWSITSLTICTTLMTLLTTVYLSLIEPWVPCVPRAQHTPRFQAATTAKSWQDGQEPTAEPGAVVDGGDAKE